MEWGREREVLAKGPSDFLLIFRKLAPWRGGREVVERGASPGSFFQT